MDIVHKIFQFQKKIEKMMKNKNTIEIHDETMYNDGKIRPIFSFQKQCLMSKMKKKKSASINAIYNILSVEFFGEMICPEMICPTLQKYQLKIIIQQILKHLSFH